MLLTLICLYRFLEEKTVMKFQLFCLILFGMVYAQFSGIQSKLVQCEKNCCNSSGGIWDNTAQYCNISKNNSYNAYTKCDNKCYENANKKLEDLGGHPSLCCAPTAVVLSLIGFVVIRKAK
jgi:hypothetical protein